MSVPGATETPVSGTPVGGDTPIGGTPVGGTPVGGTSTGTVTTPGAAPAAPGISPGQMAVLRKIATDADFRLLFATDPIEAITGADLKVTTMDYVKLEALGKTQLEQVAEGVQALVGAGAASGLRAEGTSTLVWAVVVALLLA